MSVMRYFLRRDIGSGWMVLLTFISQVACGIMSEEKWLASPRNSLSSWDQDMQQVRHSGQAPERKAASASAMAVLNAGHRPNFFTDELLTASSYRKGMANHPPKHSRNLMQSTRPHFLFDTKPSDSELSRVRDLYYNSRNSYTDLLSLFLLNGPSAVTKRRTVLGDDGLDEALLQTDGVSRSLTRSSLNPRHMQGWGPAEAISGRQFPSVERPYKDSVARTGDSVADTVAVNADQPLLSGISADWMEARENGRQTSSSHAPHRSLDLFRRLQRQEADPNVRYDDYPTPSPPVQNVTLHPTPHTPATPKATLQVPTAGPHKLPLVPTLAPLRLTSSSAAGVQSGYNVFPSEFPFGTPSDPNQTHSAMSLGQGGSSSSENLIPNVLVHARDFVVGDTDSFGAVLGATQPEDTVSLAAVSGGAQHSELACLQYVSVEHDLPCGTRQRRDVLDKQHLTLLLQQHGGSASSPFTAPTLQAASSSFRNLMPLGVPEMDEHIQFKYTRDQIQKMLEEHHRPKSHTRFAIPKLPSENDRSAFGHTLKNRHSTKGQRERMASSDFVRGSSEGLSQLPLAFVQQMVPAQFLPTPRDSTRLRKRSFDGEDRESYACEYSVDCQHFDASGCPGNQTEMVLDDNNCHTCQCKAQETVSGYCQTSSLSSSSSSSSTSSSSSHVQAAHVHLCTQCQHVRHLGDDVFPSYVQEVVCHHSDGPCLDISGYAQGLCKESLVPMTFLRRVPDRCMKIQLTSGQSLLTDDWQVYQGMVRTGCQCLVDKRSPLAASLVHS
ncbi:uncharacterized protein LOC143294331 [Babylonia areolata]|uniref:uncharacterized protein LOC143294331 n=1 Tax=Babylonia areolata TaxID=304850 RepID=UPI003FCEFBB9